MKPEKILEIARRFTVPEVVGAKEWPMVYWEFCEEELIAFAQSVIEADRESSDEPVGDFGLVMELCAALEIASYSIQDEEAKQSAIGACNYGRNRVKDRRPAPAQDPLSDEEIRTLGEAFRNNINREKFIDFARAIEKVHGIGETE